ncbi:MAG: hypothetical protein IPM99_16560 [Rubrivivax sp.]|nr:hypothetical protein [Rubrivivax sp.]
MVLGIVAVMVGVGAPSFDEVRATRLLDVAAAQLRTDVQLARSTAVAIGQTVRLQVQSEAAGSCYLLHTGPPAAAVAPRGHGQLRRSSAIAAHRSLRPGTGPGPEGQCRQHGLRAHPGHGDPHGHADDEHPPRRPAQGGGQRHGTGAQLQGRRRPARLSGLLTRLERFRSTTGSQHPTDGIKCERQAGGPCR